VNLIAQTPLRSNAEAVTDQQHPDHQLGINRSPADGAVEWRQVPPDLLKTRRKAIERGAEGLLTKPIDFALLRQEIDTRPVCNSRPQ
jgi:hypothetical protein